MKGDVSRSRKGRRYYKEGRVLWVIKKGGTVFGKVMGTYPYYVELNLSTGENVCTCPLGGECKHVTAVRTAVEEGDFIEVGEPAAELYPEAFAWLHLLKTPKVALNVSMKELIYFMDSDESGSTTAMLFLRTLKLAEMAGNLNAVEKLESLLREYSEVFSDYDLVNRLMDKLRETLIGLGV